VDIGGLHLTEYSVESAPMGDLHTHQPHTDAFYVLEGELEVATSETETARLGPAVSRWPRPAPCTRSRSRSGRFLNIHAPGMNLAAYLREVVALGDRGQKPSRELFERYDQHDLDLRS
jgi:hypothetical protein